MFSRRIVLAGTAGGRMFRIEVDRYLPLLSTFLVKETQIRKNDEKIV
jgi:hypothetical protein